MILKILLNTISTKIPSSILEIISEFAASECEILNCNICEKQFYSTSTNL